MLRISYIICCFLCCFIQGEEVSSTVFTLESSAFKHNKPIPSKYTCDGDNISPELQWSGAPQDAKSFVLIVDDPDAPGKTWVHWVLFNIDASIKYIAEGSSAGIQGDTDFNAAKYGGPCPPSGIHHYHFKLYALDMKLDLPKGATKQQVEQAMEGHILGRAELIGLYQRK